MQHPYYECLTCKIIFKSPDRYRSPKYCSRKCFQIRIKTEDTIKKMSNAKKGRIPWNKGVNMWEGKEHPRGTLGKPSKLKGRKLTEEHRKKLCFPKPKPTLRQVDFICIQCSKSFHSKNGFNGYIPKFCSQKCMGISKRKDKNCPVCQKHVSWINSKYCSRKCSSFDRNGFKMSEESKKRMSISRLGNPLARGKNHYFWKGGISSENEKIRRSHEYTEWRKKVFKRDDYTCQICSVRGSFIHADHILPFSIYPELRFEISNGRTLCVSCHKKTDTYGSKIRKYAKKS